MDLWPTFGMPVVIAAASASLLVVGLPRGRRH
jgi:hypothetical protein